MKHKALIGIVLLSMISLPLIKESASSPETTINIDPSTSEVSVGNTFLINISVTDVFDLFGFEFYLGYDTTFLDVLNVVIQPPFDRGLHPLVEIVEPDGYVHVVATLLSGDPSVSGSFPLTSITFNTTSTGSCILDLYDTNLIDSMLNPILHTSINGFVTAYSPKLLLETDKRMYKLGENITITLTNIGNQTVEIGGYPAWQIFTHPEEDPIYPEVFLYLAWSLDPGENDTFTWNQYNQFNESFCGLGTYVVRDTQGWGLFTYFKIVDAEIIVPDDYPTFQEAINNANERDTIFVKAGTYYEHVVVNKTVSLIGESRDTTIIDGNKTGNVVHVKADNVSISEFTIRQGDNAILVEDSYNSSISDNNIIGYSVLFRVYGTGIHLSSSSNCSVSGNNVYGNMVAIRTRDSSGCSISGNTVKYNTYGILLDGDSSDSSVLGNNVEDNRYGIMLGDFFSPPENTVLRNNNMTGNSYNFGIRPYFPGPSSALISLDIDASNLVDGKPIYYWTNQREKVIPVDAGYVAIINSTNITVENLTLTRNLQGVLLAYTTNSTIRNVTATTNYRGIHLFMSFGCHISENNVNRNEHGITLTLSSNCSVTGNNVEDNWSYVWGTGTGIELSGSSDNVIYHNSFVNNENQVRAYAEYANSWDAGYPRGGNYWSDYGGVDWFSGPYQNETESDGIGDSPYAINANNTDSYPLMDPHDIGITRLESKSVVGQQLDLRIDVTIFNYGMFAETFNVTAYADTTVIQTETVTLTSRNSTTITFTWNTTGFAKGNYTLSAVADTVPSETDTADNNFTGWVIVAIIGDVSGPDGWPDGEVNIMDLTAIAIIFGVNYPDPRYNANYDLNDDGKINIADLTKAAKHFGETDP